MNKKTYYAVLDEYTALVEQKQFNEQFFDAARFAKIKKRLCEHIQSQLHSLDYYTLKRPYAISFKNMADKLGVLSQNHS